MAGPEPSTTRRRVLGAAAALPVLAFAPPVRAEPVEVPPSLPDRSLWNRRLALYQRLAAETEQAATAGWFRAANDRYKRQIAAIEALRAADPGRDGKRLDRLRRAAFRRIDKAENVYWHKCTAPMQRAAAALVLTPAPDLAALGVKLAVIRAHQLHELDSMIRDCFEVLSKDVRLLSQPGPSH
jgi:hypothetical protein